ncbi:unnamed protein product [Clonostachys rosea]|uniref:Uncharacterized protein n=1 Tax=Bionectria ochroleuca TaxID=29856 RepID=A0ABY6URL8_BIOOC|nr:unnamed protein product [Clonostachys rosea]
MDQNSFAADESTALTSSREQTAAARAILALSYWYTDNEREWDISVLAGVYGRSANRYLEKYFECLDRLPASSAELITAPSRLQEVCTREGNEAERNFWQLKISHDTAVQDLEVLDEILNRAKEQEKPPGRAVSPGLAAWTFMCSILALALPHKVPSTVFKVGALAGALLFTSGLLRKVPRVSKLEPVQHKVQGLIRSFEEGTMRHRDRSEVLIPPLDSFMGC